MAPETREPLEKEDVRLLRHPARIFLITLIAVGFLLGAFSVDVLPHQSKALSAPILVKNVIDGDTIELVSGVKVRYIGVDSPEMHRKIGSRWVKVTEPYAKEAYEFNRRLVEGKRIRLGLDIEAHDRYGRMLAYVYTEDRSTGSLKLINAEILKAGLARLMLLPPNLHYSELFHVLEEEAQLQKRGLWKIEPPAAKELDKTEKRLSKGIP